MFAILAAIGVMFGLSLARVPVVFALIIGAVTGGLLAGLGPVSYTHLTLPTKRIEEESGVAVA